VKEYKPAIIHTSHYMDDITHLADQLLLISQGQIVYDGSVEHFISTTDLKKKLVYRLKNATEEKEIVYHSHELTKVLSDLAHAGELADLKVEEVDFEDVIHRFLATESRTR
ncbi:MAG: ABC transporter ATP-binding protein, partial [Pseudobdellovibrio sp.]